METIVLNMKATKAGLVNIPGHLNVIQLGLIERVHCSVLEVHGRCGDLWRPSGSSLFGGRKLGSQVTGGWKCRT